MRVQLQKIHLPELHRNFHIQDAIFHPISPPSILYSLSCIQTLSIYTFLHQLRNLPTNGFITTRLFLRYIIACFLSLNINSNIHTATLGARNLPKKWISDFQALRVGDLLLNSSNFPTNFCNLLQPLPLSLALI